MTGMTGHDGSILYRPTRTRVRVIREKPSYPVITRHAVMGVQVAGLMLGVLAANTRAGVGA